MDYLNERLRAIFRVAIARERRKYLAGYKYLNLIYNKNIDNDYLINGIKDLYRSFNKLFKIKNSFCKILFPALFSIKIISDINKNNF